MTNLFDFYKDLKGFVEGHRMIHNFKVIGSISEVDTMNVDSRSLFISVESGNISHRNNTNTVTFALFAVDKCISDDEESLVSSIQENIFVIGQVQDFILSIDNDVDFEEVTIAQAPTDDYNLTAAVCSFEVEFDKNIVCTDYSLDSTYVPQLISQYFEGSGGVVATFLQADIAIDIITQQGSRGNIFIITEMIDAEHYGKDLYVEFTDALGHKKIVSETIDSVLNGIVTINENLLSIFSVSAELRVRFWIADAVGNRYIKNPTTNTYEETLIDFIAYGSNIKPRDPAFAGGTVPSGVIVDTTDDVNFSATVTYPYRGFVVGYRDSAEFEFQIVKATNPATVQTTVYNTSGNTSTFLYDYNPIVTLQGNQTFIDELDCNLVWFIPKYREKIVARDGSLKWGAFSYNGYLVVSSSTLPPC
jgi:hypothetical protein